MSNFYMCINSLMVAQLLSSKHMIFTTLWTDWWFLTYTFFVLVLCLASCPLFLSPSSHCQHRSSLICTKILVHNPHARTPLVPSGNLDLGLSFLSWSRPSHIPSCPRVSCPLSWSRPSHVLSRFRPWRLPARSARGCKTFRHEREEYWQKGMPRKPKKTRGSVGW